MKDLDLSLFETNRKLNEREFEERKAVLDSWPMELLVVLTTRCNLRCIMCTREVSNKVLPEKAVLKLKELFPYLESVDWQGGEPFCVEHFGSLVRLAAEHPNINQWITTSGILITRDWADLLVGCRVFLGFSIDGVTRETYEYIRRGAKFERLLQSLYFIKNAQERHETRQPMNMIVTVMRSNHRELEMFLDFAREHGFNTVSFKPVLYITDRENIFHHKDPDALSFLRNIHPVIMEKGKEYRVRVDWNLPVGQDPGPSHEVRAQSDVPGPAPGPSALLCSRPWKKMVVDVSREANVYPECFCTVPVGNLNTDPLPQIWNSPAMQEYRRRIAQNKIEGFCSNACTSRQVAPSLLVGDDRK